MSEITLQSKSLIPTSYGTMDFLAFAKSLDEKMPQLAIVSPDIDTTKPVLLRIHSECMTGDVFGSQKCDCGEQLNSSLRSIERDNGIVIYLRQEGRGIGLIQKLKAYQLQADGLDTVEANLELGHQADQRDYIDAVNILKFLHIKKVKLLTNNPEKINFLESNGIEVVERIPIVLPPHSESLKYFNTKRDKMGHLLPDNIR